MKETEDLAAEFGQRPVVTLVHVSYIVSRYFRAPGELFAHHRDQSARAPLPIGMQVHPLVHTLDGARQNAFAEPDGHDEDLVQGNLTRSEERRVGKGGRRGGRESST